MQIGSFLALGRRDLAAIKRSSTVSLNAFLIKLKLPNPQTGRLTNDESTPQQTRVKVRVIGYGVRVTG